MGVKEDLEAFQVARAEAIADAELVLRLKEAVNEELIPARAAAEAIRFASVRLGEETIPAYLLALKRLQTNGGK
ncbi:hypothetical protein [Myxococcus sp. AS-1-15]|uniref:hypothetical protein n=1 Tax=Myxococcus sp. AS-1-15 TaxID=2874600 RepID=UPI001CBE23E6|nr:hypothetical protein [Myxococcus sp. AS-1-15]MBZ4402023.1 hypothetical protein [Myxococcus sp. AS-1-15]